MPILSLYFAFHCTFIHWLKIFINIYFKHYVELFQFCLYHNTMTKILKTDMIRDVFETSETETNDEAMSQIIYLFKLKIWNLKYKQGFIVENH